MADGDQIENLHLREIPIQVIFGPTGSGKTARSLTLARSLSGEVISTDSRQIYREISIGTGKILPDEMGEIPHHGIDIISIKEVYNAALFAVYARKKIAEIRARGNVPILCGGTGLYLDATLYDLDTPPFQSNPEFQAELEQYRKNHGNTALWEELFALDPEYAKELHPNSYPYVMRAIEVKKVTGKSKRDFRTNRTSLYETNWIWTFDDDREKLYKNINHRVEKMFETGWIEEVRGLLKQGFDLDTPGMNTIGYREIGNFLINSEENTIHSEQELIEKVKQLNRNYAKRQITWFRRSKSPK